MGSRERFVEAVLALVALATFAWAGTADASSGGEIDIEGAWYLLIHYRDDNSANPDVERWEDRVWVFERSGSRLKWRRYPIVVFDDESGRFERRLSGQYARVMHFWEPSESQRLDIRNGLQVNDRGSTSKTLRASDDGWASSNRGRPSSASVITYTESWTIEGLPDMPVFIRRDIMGSARSDNIEGMTRFTATEVSATGKRLRGTYERDGTKHGTFRMMRSGAAEALKSRKTQSDLQRLASIRTLRADEEARREYREDIDEYLSARGAFLSEAQLDALVEAALEQLLAGATNEEVGDFLNARVHEMMGGLGKGDEAELAVHDDSVRYALPFDSAVPRRAAAAVGGDTAMTVLGVSSDYSGHLGWWRYSFDFEMPPDIAVLAARDGVVTSVMKRFSELSRRQGRPTPTHAVIVLHADGTYAMYGHLKPEVAVNVGDRVEVGDELGRSRGPLLHFGVARTTPGGEQESVDIRFDDGSPEGVVPVSGLTYGGHGMARDESAP